LYHWCSKGFSFSAVLLFNVTLALIIDCSWNAVFISLLFQRNLTLVYFVSRQMMGGSAGKGTGKDVEGGHGVAVLS
jgi:hypothetical protein